MPSFYLASSHPGSIACSGLLQEPSLAIGLQGGMRPLLSEVTDPRPAREQDMLGTEIRSRIGCHGGKSVGRQRCGTRSQAMRLSTTSSR